MRVTASNWLALLIAFAACLYFPYLNAGYFSDDFLFYYNSPPSHLYDYFSSTGAVAHAYRPLEAIFLTIVQQHFAFQTWPIHTVAVLAHIVLCALVIVTGARLGFSSAGKALACILVLVSQAAPPAMLGNDTLSQAMSSMLGALSLVLFGTAYFNDKLERRPQVSLTLYFSSVVCFLASLFFKETAVGFSLVFCAIAYAAAPRQRGLLSRIGMALPPLLPFGTGGIVYLAARIHAGGQFGSQDDAYKISAGFNVIRNLGLFAAGAFSPLSSVTVAEAAQTKDLLIQVTGVAGIVLIAAVILWGILRTPRKSLVIWLVGCSLAALFPAFLLQHVSELYFYNAIPFVALLFSLALGSLWKRTVVARAAAAACAVFLIGGQIFACVQKSSLMRDNGRRATAILSTLVPRIRSLPEAGRIVLVQPPGERLKYSVYILEGFDILEFGAGRLGEIFGRPDVSVSIAEDQQILRSGSDGHTTLLMLDGNALRPWDSYGR